jgi:tetratricopeptide (TPR) repeat protein
MPLPSSAARQIARRASVPSQEITSSGSRAPGDKTPGRLGPGESVESEITGSEAHAYEIVLQNKQFLQVVVEQRRANVAIAVFDPGGKMIRAVDRSRAPVAEFVFLVAEEAGGYRLEVKLSKNESAAGKYELRTKEQPEPRQEDISRAAGEKVLDEAYRLSSEGTAATKRKALEKFNEALPLMRAVGCRELEACAIYGIAQIYITSGEEQKALEYFTQLLPIQRELGDRTGEGSTLTDIGTAHFSLGEARKALEYHNQALPVFRELGDRGLQIAALGNIGSIHDFLGDRQKALGCYKECLRLVESLPDLPVNKRIVVALLNNAGRLSNSLGEEQTALDYYNRALTLSRAIPYPKGRRPDTQLHAFFLQFSG